MKAAQIQNKIELPTFPSMASCAAVTSIPMRALKTAKAAGCKAFDKHGRVELAPLLAWLFAETNKKVDWKDRMISAQAQREELRLSRDQGRTLDLGETQRRAAEAEGWHYDQWDRQLREMPSSLAGLDALTIHQRLETFIRNVKQISREKFNAIAPNGKEA